MTIQKILNSNNYKNGSVVTAVDRLGNYKSLNTGYSTLDLSELDDWTYEITATGANESSSLYLPEGEWNLFITAASWGAAKIQISGDNSEWFDGTDDNDNTISFTGNDSEQISGNVYIRLYVTSYSANIKLTARKYKNA